MRKCSLCRKLQVVRGRIEDYRHLAHYHYLDGRLGPAASIFALKPISDLAGVLRSQPVGVIVYAMPSPRLALRNVATGDLFSGFDRSTKLALINRNIRCIARVIVEPRFRSLGLASRMVRETMPQMNVPIVEALAVMGVANPFFEKAGMRPFKAPVPEHCIEFIEALSMVGIEENDLVDPQKVQHKLERVRTQKAEFIECQVKRFLKGYGKRREMSPGFERTRYILSKISFRPVYYIWLNTQIPVHT
jgi:hypothetical protein